MQENLPRIAAALIALALAAAAPADERPPDPAWSEGQSPDGVRSARSAPTIQAFTSGTTGVLASRMWSMRFVNRTEPFRSPRSWQQVSASPSGVGSSPCTSRKPAVSSAW